MPSPLEPDILDALRQATSSLHAQVDQCLPLARPSPSLADYRSHLRMLEAWLQRLAGLEPAPPALATHRAQLAGDLAACAALLPPDAVTRAPTPPTRTSPGLAFVWGVSYVLEGSRLGGRVLYRQLAERLAPHPLNYLQGAGEQTGAQWKAFLAQLRDQAFGPAEVRSACDGAVEAFETLLACHREAIP
ncbi:biliverdin-producing heme oxygenase [Variovorax arabinosiphilus]|uniref:biliverdin-producing heme oxygenase n=1 Tax=Variovorax arabinosiphilus TaxID=3053498 RepID=UPI002574F686|nr:MULTISPECIES: biliverdin-producing heme oxygenase [unclassified Variovorax]MDM0120926.1 biliverdin-producing heme oxygenase [Variovorax sp. J2L1-78]MDM0129987.1 biliverdin-producing heme oxygenase [Variovorax sp. J2L1-63]MDM0233689.1 biliverdin-producing heme oxygenase [Variovorax sp. J2R1-6]